MPSILFHLTFANMIYSKIHNVVDKNLFMSGNLIPDLAKDKEASHYRTNAALDGFFVPDMKRVYDELFIVSNSMYLGLFCHLYLDSAFIEEFLFKQFYFDYSKKQVLNVNNGKTWSFEYFFSKDGLYASYTKINKLLINDGYIKIEDLKNMPELLPLTGIKKFDVRRNKTWREELYEYLNEKADSETDILDYEKLCEFIFSCSTKLLSQIN